MTSDLPARCIAAETSFSALVEANGTKALTVRRSGRGYTLALRSAVADVEFVLGASEGRPCRFKNLTAVVQKALGFGVMVLDFAWVKK